MDCASTRTGRAGCGLSAPPTRCHLAAELGRVLRSIHDCPLPEDPVLPLLDARHWRRTVVETLFAGDDLHEALLNLCPQLEEAVRTCLSVAQDIPIKDQPGLVWRDASLHNTVVAEGSYDLQGVFDFQSALRQQPPICANRSGNSSERGLVRPKKRPSGAHSARRTGVVCHSIQPRQRLQISVARRYRSATGGR